ncbi:YhjD/YihY/BrkB family envelope integrity protein [Nocardioides sp.]|uniref:YhjD/YihY/BrkB family envelope integrity protein n=1 Tax=Nocardioides sp. TaxID=35761 RepID=UPI002ED19D77
MDETWEESGPETLAAERVEAVLRRLPPRLRVPLTRILSRWLGRTLIRATDAFLRLEVFDRAMTIAAQFFTSVLPILILAATWASAGDSSRISDILGMPDQSRSVIDEAVQGADTAAFGIAGTLLVLISATSLSRALTRAFAAIWRVPRPRTGLRSAWRWFAVVVVLTLAVIFGNSLSQQASVLPPREIWPIAVSVLGDVVVATFVPWVLLSGGVAARRLFPGAALFAVVMLAVRPASDVWLPRALDVSADRYGSIGLAFTYLAWLYVVSLVFIASAVLGQVIASDAGRLGAWVRGVSPPPT